MKDLINLKRPALASTEDDCKWVLHCLDTLDVAAKKIQFVGVEDLIHYMRDHVSCLTPILQGRALFLEV